MQSKLKGNLILALTALIWGLSFISQTTSMDHIEPSTFNGIRMLIGSAVLLPFIFFSNKKQDGGKENDGKSPGKEDGSKENCGEKDYGEEDRRQDHNEEDGENIL